MNESARTRTLAATLAVGAFAVAAGCTHSSDPNAAPYGEAATPAPGTLSPVVLASGSIAKVATAEPTPAKAAPTAPPDVVVPAASPSADAGATPTGNVPMSGGPMMGGMGSSPTAPLTPTPEMDKKIAEAEKSGKKPDIATAYAMRGTFRMNDNEAGARIKYRAALQDYRKALAADPTNAEAKKNKELIEGIYKEMGRPIPE